MKTAIICFTQTGYEKMNKLLKTADSELEFEGFCKCETLRGSCDNYVDESVSEWTGRQFAEKKALLFIGAAGIAVRAIAPCVNDKLSDNAVLVMDDAARYVIPVLSGHYGGANALAVRIAGIMGATPVITTSTDVNNKFAVDVFARENNLRIVNKSGIAGVSAKALRGEDIVIGLADGVAESGFKFAPEDNKSAEPKSTRAETVRLVHGAAHCDVWIGDSDKEKPEALLYLEPREYALGIGCRRGKSEGEIRTFVFKELTWLGINPEQIFCIASIDLKADEEGLVSFARHEGIDFKTYSADELAEIPGEFTDSEFVQENTGVGGVAERAAMAACGGAGHLVLKKQAENGMTVAVAKKS